VRGYRLAAVRPTIEFPCSLVRAKTKNKPTSKGGFETFKNVVFLVFPKGFLVFPKFCLVFFGFPKCFCFLKALGKTKNQKNKPISKGVSETFKNFIFWFSQRFF